LIETSTVNRKKRQKIKCGSRAAFFFVGTTISEASEPPAKCQLDIKNQPWHIPAAPAAKHPDYSCHPRSDHQPLPEISGIASDFRLHCSRKNKTVQKSGSMPQKAGHQPAAAITFLTGLQ